MSDSPEDEAWLEAELEDEARIMREAAEVLALFSGADTYICKTCNNGITRSGAWLGRTTLTTTRNGAYHCTTCHYQVGGGRRKPWPHAEDCRGEPEAITARCPRCDMLVTGTYGFGVNFWSQHECRPTRTL